MIPMMAAILGASLLGSLHCAGMCGAFLALAVSPSEHVPAWRLNAAYHVGRLATYVTLGVLAGLLGSLLDLGGDMVGVQRAAAVFAGIFMVLFGGVCVARTAGVPLPRLPVPSALKAVVMRGHDLADRFAPLARAAIIGLLTTLLPCGWLYAFVATAAGTGDPLHGGLAMAVFWLGTLPVMAMVGFFVQNAMGPVRRVMPITVSVLLIVMGVVTLLGRVRTIETGGAHNTAVCHDVR